MSNIKPTNNIQPAERLSTTSEYYFSKKLKQIAEMNSSGQPVINLGIGSPDNPPPKQVIESLCTHARKKDTHGYQPYNGIPELRKGFAEWYKKWYGVDLNPQNEIQPLIGSKEGVLHITLAFVNPGDKVLVPNPGYPTYTSLSELLGAEVIKYNLTEENNWYPDFDELEQADLDGVKLMWINYPHMPTGAKATPQLFEKLVQFARSRNIVLINDNPYSFILNKHPLSLLSIPNAKECCIELNSMSKSHNMPGWRIGMLASNATFEEWILKVKSNIDSGMFRPLQIAATEALQVDENWYELNNEQYKERRVLAERIMDTLACSYDKNQVGLFLWGRIPEEYNDVEELTEEILQKAKVFITPGFIFGTNGKRYIRISLCSPLDKLNEALQRIKQIMNTNIIK
ncbi:MAG: aminotransferase class I/II-fold pyridoxal phosphate-dependent enzyme [Bacteroidales bacterium]|nr:aminotransferase class I/II-fold pyridoxal phosphate-dependent enzyme [Bacteroidales bacterium]